MSRSRKRPRRSLLARLELLLWIAAVCLLGWVVWVELDGRLYQVRAENALATAHEEVAAATTENAQKVSSTAPPDEALALSPGDPIGRIEIPRLELSVVAAEGDDHATLRRAVGHLPSTPLPGSGGNTAFAGHRDRHFRSLENIAIGDEILVTTPQRKVRYRVEWTRVVPPDALEVVDPTTTPSLTLITCHPFDFIGPAPDRFVVRATQVESTAGWTG